MNVDSSAPALRDGSDISTRRHWWKSDIGASMGDQEHLCQLAQQFLNVAANLLPQHDDGRPASSMHVDHTTTGAAVVEAHFPQHSAIQPVTAQLERLIWTKSTASTERSTRTLDYDAADEDVDFLLLDGPARKSIVQVIHACASLLASHFFQHTTTGNLTGNSSEENPFLESSVEFISTAYQCLEHDLVFASISAHLVVPVHTRELTVLDVLAHILLEYTSNRNIGTNDVSVTKRWYRSTLSSNAFLAISHGVRAAEFVQRHTTTTSCSNTSVLPPVDSVLGRGLSLGLETRHELMEKIARCAVDFILCGETMVEGPLLSATDMEADENDRIHLFAACAAFLSTTIRIDIADWMYPPIEKHTQSNVVDQAMILEETDVKQLCRTLLQRIHQLCVDGLFIQSYHSAILSLSLLSLIKWKYDDSSGDINETALLNSSYTEYITLVGLSFSNFYSQDELLPLRWTHRPSRAIKTTALDAISDICRIQGDTLSTIKLIPTLERYMKHCWAILLPAGEVLQDTNKCGIIRHSLHSLLVLYSVSQTAVRQALLSLDHAEANDVMRRMNASLLFLCTHKQYEIASMSSLLWKSLLQNSPRISYKDTLSRNIWASLDRVSNFQQSCHSLLSYTEHLCLNNNEANKLGSPLLFSRPVLSDFLPRLCSSLDVLHTLCDLDGYCKLVLNLCVHSNRDFLISLKNILTPKMLRSNENPSPKTVRRRLFSENGTGGLATQESTSEDHDVLVDSFCSTVFPTLLLSTGKLGCAHILVRLGSLNFEYHEEENTSNSNSTMEQMMAIANDMNQSLRNAQGNISKTIELGLMQSESRDLTARSLRLLSRWSSSSASNDDYLANAIFTNYATESIEINNYQRKLLSYEAQLPKLKKEMNTLKGERDSLRDRLKYMRISSEQEVRRVRDKAQTDAMDTIEIHVHEREKAESNSRKYKELLSVEEERRREAESQVASAMSEVGSLKADLVDCFAKIRELEANIGERTVKINELEIETANSSRALEESKRDLEESEQKKNSVEDQLKFAEQNLMETKESLRERGEHVEESCSKLISLAQIFQEREKREIQLKERLRNVESRAENDIERLQVQFSTSRKSEQQLKDENAELRRKLSKTRKKLEEESNERHRIEAEMKQRRGPVSYINQLHTSSLSSDKHGRSSEHSSRHRGKENSGRRKDDRNYS